MTGSGSSVLTCSVVIPTYGRDDVLVDTVRHMLAQRPPALEILVVDQTPRHGAACARQLSAWAHDGQIVWEQQVQPSVTKAMNHGLLLAQGDVVLFVDDDVVPDERLVAQHLAAHVAGKASLVVGRVAQPWDASAELHAAQPTDSNPYAGGPPGFREEFIGCNFSVRRREALALGGFDENFVRVAYRYEAEFSSRWSRMGHSIWFEPSAMLRHLKAPSGGTRVYGDHLRTAWPAHAVGEYYFLLRARPAGWAVRWFLRPLRSVCTRYHLKHPWWIPLALFAEFSGFLWAFMLWMRGPRLLASEASTVVATHATRVTPP